MRYYDDAPRVRHPLEQSPREVWLEARVAHLEREIFDLRNNTPLKQFSAYADADEIVIAPSQSPVFHTLAIGSMDSAVDNLHVRTLCWLNNKKAIRYEYLVSQDLLARMPDSSKVDMMAEHHKRLVFNVGRQLWSDD